MAHAQTKVRVTVKIELYLRWIRRGLAFVL